MKISVNSWHYRFAKDFYPDNGWMHRASLCQYFWRVFFALLASAVMVAAALAFVLLVCAVIFEIVVGLTNVYAASPLNFFKIIGGVVTVALAIYAPFWRKKRNKRMKEEGTYVYKPYTPSLLHLAYWRYRAWKQGVCPIIEFVDPNKPSIVNVYHEED